MEEVYIVQAYRTAVGRSKKGKINFVRPDDLGAQLLEKMVKKLPNFNKEIIDDKINGFLYNNKEDLTILIRKLISGSVDLESVSKSAVEKMKLNNSLGFLANKEFADLKELGH